MSDSNRLKRLGWFQLIIGLLLVVSMVLITVNVGPLLLTPGVSQGGSTFTGTPEQSRLIVILFALIAVFGLMAMVNGIWQIKTGRRNTVILVIVVLVIVALVLSVWRVTSALD
jgi:cation transport ATPase